MPDALHFADLKNDFVFRRVFGKRAELMSALLNDLLGREGPRAIVELEYLSAEHAPELDGAKAAVIDVKCRDAGGAIFLVEIQLLHVSRFLKRVIYNACRAYTAQMSRGETFQDLADVVALTICDFELWPDEEQQSRGAPQVPMVSRWRMVESASGAEGPTHLSHVFVEMPKLPLRSPTVGVELWAWLFRMAPELHKIPDALLLESPYRSALELADLSTFTAGELEAYRKVNDEIEQTRQIAKDAELRGRREGLIEGRQEGRVEGKREGLAEGEAKGRRTALRSMLLRWIHKQGLACSDGDRRRIDEETSVEVLERWAERVVGASSVEEIFGEAGD